MKADFTRNTFDPGKHFTRVLMQQGRVQLDADWNEQAAILLKYLRSLAADVIGPYGGPIANLGFKISDSNIATNFGICPGHYYVDGILCELASGSPGVPIQPVKGNTKQFQIPASSVANFVSQQPVLLSADGASILTTAIQVPAVSGDTATITVDTDVTAIVNANNRVAYPSGFVTFLHQPDYPLPAGMTLAPGLIYLDVWERLVTYIEDDSIREVALGGADTAARSKLVCQVKQWPEGSDESILKKQFQPDNRGRLKAVAKLQSASSDPCIIAPDASYRGPENQLYRVEIHTGNMDSSGKSPTSSSTPPTFKWSRENGSVIFPIVSLNSGGGTTTVVLENLGRDDRFGLNQNDWVEIFDDDYVLQNRGETLLQVQSIAGGSLTVTLAGTPASAVGQDVSKHPLLRRWDQSFADPAQGGLQQASPDNAATIVEGSDDDNWLSLENGIQIQFQTMPQGTNLYRTGDYWLIPARAATGDIIWPSAKGEPLALPPDGVDHHYAPLAVIKLAPSVQVNTFCQRQFAPPPQA
jgi:hypothetical protein